MTNGKQSMLGGTNNSQTAIDTAYFGNWQNPFTCPEDVQSVVICVRKACEGLISASPIDNSDEAIIIDLEAKNKLNQLSAEFVEEILVLEPHTTAVRDFLKDPRNEDLTEAHRRTKSDLRLYVSKEQSSGISFEAAFYAIFNSILQSGHLQSNKDRTEILIYLAYLYLSCQIGKKETPISNATNTDG